MIFLVTEDEELQYNFGETLNPPIRAYFLASDSILDSEEIALNYSDGKSEIIRLELVDTKDGKFYYTLTQNMLESLSYELQTPTPTPTQTPTPTPISSDVDLTSTIDCAEVALHIQSDTYDGDTTFVDLSDNDHPITITDNAKHTTTNAYLGSTSIHLEGFEPVDYLSVGNPNYFKFLHDKTSNWTIECWFYRDTYPPYETLFSNAPSTTRDGIRFKYQGNNKLALHICNGTTTLSFDEHVMVSTIYEWVHCALVYDGTHIACYINGNEGFKKEWTGSVSDRNPTYNFTIGANATNGNAWHGYVQDFRISKKAVYTENFTPPTKLHNSVCD